MDSLRFGVVLLPYSTPFKRVLGAAVRAEQLGFDSVWVPDHLQRAGLSVLECWTTISALAASTSKVTLGSLATCNSFRNPAMLAKLVATVSEISGGRVELGIGVGYDDSEHAAYGYPFPNLRDRVSALSETLQILGALWGGSKVDFRGTRFTLRGTVCLPAPTKMPKVWVAGRSDAILEAAGSGGAYGVNVLPYRGTGDRRKMSSRAELRELAERIDSHTGLGKSMYCGDGGVVIGKNQSEYSRNLANASGFAGLSDAEMVERLHNLSAVFGTVEECQRSVEFLSSLGFEELMLIFPGWQDDDYSNMETFADAFLR